MGRPASGRSLNLILGEDAQVVMNICTYICICRIYALSSMRRKYVQSRNIFTYYYQKIKR